MAERVSISCPNCGRILLIPPQVLGHGGRCRHCGHLFQPRVHGDSDQELFMSSYCCPPWEAAAPGASEPMLSSSTSPVLAPSDQVEPRAAPQLELFPGLAGVCRRLVAGVGEQAGRLQSLDPKRWLVLLRSRAPWPGRRDDPGPAPGPAALELARDREAARAATDDWRSLVAAIRERAADASRLKQELQADLAEVETIRDELKEACTFFIDPNSRAALAKIRELELLRADFGRLREEARIVRFQLEAQATEAQNRCVHLTEEGDAARAEGDRWKAQHAAIERELEQIRDLLGAERDALAREADQLQARYAELERSREEADCRHEWERASWETRRKELEDGSERHRRALVEAEDRLAQQQAGFEAERQFWRRQLDEQARRLTQLQRDVVIDPEAARTHLEHWLAEAHARLEGFGANPDRLSGQALSRWLEYQIRTACEQIALLEREQVQNPSGPAEEPAAPQPALIMDPSPCPAAHGD